MKVLPAIDIKDGCCVRLLQGEFNKKQVYSKNPLEVALKWQGEGCDFLHVVDLDGAKNTSLVNKTIIKDLCKKLNIPIQIGGGIRSEERVKELLDLGVSRVIVSTLAIENQDLLKGLISKYDDKIVVSVDAKENKVAIKGWREVCDIDSIELCKGLEELGIKTIVYTDVSKDGMLSGPNLNVYEELKRNTKLNIIAAGGVSTYEDLKILNEIGVYGAIIGNALYKGNINLRKVYQWLQKE